MPARNNEAWTTVMTTWTSRTELSVRWVEADGKTRETMTGVTPARVHRSVASRTTTRYVTRP